MNLQYSQFITRTEFHKNRIQQMIHGNLDGLKEGEAVDNKTVIERFFGMAGAAVSSYCGDKDCFMTFIWSRAASFIYCGLRNGYGYRDTVQDIQGIIHLDPEMAVEKIRFMLSAQVNNGAGLPLVKFTHNPGYEDTPDDASYVKETGHPAYRADDALWLFPTVYKYIAETGNMAFLDEVISYPNKEEDTVYNHLKRTIDFSMNHLGVHGIPVVLHVIAGMKTDLSVALRKNDFQTAFPYRPDL